MVLCGKDDNILANNLWDLLALTEIISVTRLWPIFYVAIVMPTCWLAGNMYALKEYEWGYISLPEIIYDESSMMGLMSKWANELPPFKDYVTCKFELETTTCIASDSQTKSATQVVEERALPSR